MTELPTDQRVVGLTAELARFDARAAGVRLRKALAVERANGSEPDGWGPGHSADDGGGSGPRVLVESEDHPGELEAVPVTAVELAAIRRFAGTADPYRTAVARAALSLQTCVRSADDLLRALDAIDTLTELRDDDAGLTIEPGCWAMARVDSWEPIFRSTEFAGRRYALGRWAYDFLGRAHRLPTTEECERHKNGQKVRLPAAMVTRWTKRV